MRAPLGGHRRSRTDSCSRAIDNHEIATRVSISPGIVKSHVSSILGKLECQTAFKRPFTLSAAAWPDPARVGGHPGGPSRYRCLCGIDTGKPGWGDGLLVRAGTCAGAIGEEAFIAAGVLVDRDVPPRSVVMGAREGRPRCAGRGLGQTPALSISAGAREPSPKARLRTGRGCDPIVANCGVDEPARGQCRRS